MRRALLVLALPFALAACGGSSKHPASIPPPSTPSSPSMDNYAQIACTKIDQGRALMGSYTSDANPFENPSASTTATQDYLNALQDFHAAVQSATRSADVDVSGRGSAEYVGVLDPDQLQSHLNGWRSFCESKGWVGTP